MTPSPELKPNDLAAKYDGLRTRLRSDLHITRQSSRGEAVYVVFDPVTFQTFRLSLSDYQVAACLQESMTLAACFLQAVSEGHLSLEQADDYWQFVDRLQSLGLLTISTTSGATHFERYQKRQAAMQKARWLSLLFLTIPLVNPDRFLTRTVGRIDFLFTRVAFILFCILGALSAGIVASRWDDFVAPLNGLLAFKNLLFMSTAFIVLKVWHELGHGFACKHFGGRVTEMGCKLMAGIPLAYVDASSAWSFPKQYQRITVMLGGMYFECLVAIPAIFLWAFDPTSFVGDCAYQLIFMAGVATLLFNANPLMKYDGYFILSDVLGIPNLRQRATQELLTLLKRITLGLSSSTASPSRRMQATLLGYGLLSNLYGLMLMITIPMMIATRFQAIGLALAAFQFGGMAFATVKRLRNFLFVSPETEPVRVRARRVGYALAIGVPVLLGLCPVPTGFVVDGVVSAERAAMLRATTPGVLRYIDTKCQSHVAAQQSLLRIENQDASMASRTEAIQFDAAQRHAKFVSRTDITEGAKLHQISQQRQQMQQCAAAVESELTIRAPFTGRLTYILPSSAIGKFVQVGDPLARVVSGSTQVRAWLTEDQLLAARLNVGSQVRVRLADQSWLDHTGTILSVAPASAVEFDDFSLTSAGEGQFVVDPVTGRTLNQLFQLQVAVPELSSEDANQDARAFVRVGRRFEPIGAWAWRSAHSFINSIFINH